MIDQPQRWPPPASYPATDTERVRYNSGIATVKPSVSLLAVSAPTGCSRFFTLVKYPEKPSPNQMTSLLQYRGLETEVWVVNTNTNVSRGILAWPLQEAIATPYHFRKDWRDYQNRLDRAAGSLDHRIPFDHYDLVFACNVHGTVILKPGFESLTSWLGQHVCR